MKRSGSRSTTWIDNIDGCNWRVLDYCGVLRRIPLVNSKCLSVDDADDDDQTAVLIPQDEHKDLKYGNVRIFEFVRNNRISFEKRSQNGHFSM